MGKKSGLVLVGAGVFLLAVALLARVYAYERLAVVPLDQNSVSYSVGEDATIFDIATQQEVTKDLRSTVEVVGDVPASRQASEEMERGVAVWEKLIYTVEPGAVITEKNPPLSAGHDRVAFDRHTGEVLDCCGDYVSDTVDTGTGEEVRDSATEVAGYYFKLPFDTQKQTYPWWDGSLDQTVDLEFQRVDAIDGLTVYEFAQTVEPTDVGDINAPASIFGLEQEGDVKLDRMYSNTRTLWIEPETGVIIRSEEDQLVTAEYQGEQVATLTDVVSVFADETIADNVATYADLSSQLKLVRVWVPLLGGVLGGLLLLAGIAVLVLSRRSSRHAAY